MLDIELDGLCRSYGEKMVVNHLSFKVEGGELFGFLGPNGSGKSTTIRMLTTLLPPTKGDARIGGISIRDVWGVRSNISVLFQDPSLDLRLSAIENLEFFCALYCKGWDKKKRIAKSMEVIETVGLGHRAYDLAGTYSWGMRRRLEIARSLLTDPKVLFLDEPTTGLDPQSRAALWSHLIALQKERNMTVLVATHDMEEAARCDRLAVIDHGELQVLDTPKGFCDSQGVQYLSDAFLTLTGHAVRDEEGDGSGAVLKGKDSKIYRRG